MAKSDDWPPPEGHPMWMPPGRGNPLRPKDWPPPEAKPATPVDPECPFDLPEGATWENGEVEFRGPWTAAGELWRWRHWAESVLAGSGDGRTRSDSELRSEISGKLGRQGAYDIPDGARMMIATMKRRGTL